MMMMMVGMMVMMVGMMVMMMGMMMMMVGMMMMITCGGGVPSADPAEIPRLESKVRQPRPVEPPSGSPLHSEPERLSVLSDPDGGNQMKSLSIFFGVNILNMIVDISQLSRICVSCLCLDSGCESVSVCLCVASRV